MHLYNQSSSPNGRRVKVFLKEKGLEIETTELDLRAGENLSPEFRARNPFGRVPVLELDDGRYLSESVAICRYLESLAPDPNLFGTNPEEQAFIEMWTRRVDLSLMTFIAQSFRHSSRIFADRETCVEEWGSVARQVARDAAALFDAHLSRNEFLMGDRYCIADMLLGIAIDFAERTRQSLLDLEHIARFHKTVTARPAFAD